MLSLDSGMLPYLICEWSLNNAKCSTDDRFGLFWLFTLPDLLRTPTWSCFFARGRIGVQRVSRVAESKGSSIVKFGW